MALKRQLSVFVSSTSKDLDLYRMVAGQVIQARGWIPIMNEFWGAMPERVVDACYEKVRSADLVLLIMAFRQGFVPTVEQGGNGIDSITALEIEHARTHNIPVLGLLANEQTWPGSQYEKAQAARDWVEQFRARFGQPAEFFDPEQWTPPPAKEPDQLPQFRTKVGGVLLGYQEQLLAKQTKSFKRR